MNGDKVFFDTNAFIYFLEGRKPLQELVVVSSEIFYSVITEIELLSSRA